MSTVDLPEDGSAVASAVGAVPQTRVAADGTLTSRIESLDVEGRGVARQDGKVAFIEGALPGELVRWQRRRAKARFDTGELIEVIEASNQRVAARCAHFGLHRGACGGCSMQHLDARAQVSIKQRALEENLVRIGHVRPQMMLRPVCGPTWGYRHRARLTVRYVERKGGSLVGFHERASSYVADMTRCEVLAEPVGSLIEPMRELVSQLSLRERLPQIEVAISAGVTVLVFRILQAISADDRVLLRQFARSHRVAIWLQTAGPDTAAPMDEEDQAALTVDLPEFDIRLPFRPTDFTQVNHRINEVLVRRALALLEPQAQDVVVDFFCGMGNFTFPLARRAAKVTGLEGNPALLRRAEATAGLHGLDAKVRFQARNLFEWESADWQTLKEGLGGHVDRVLIDPPRDGALAVVQALSRDPQPPARVVYVSCNPSTLARDCAILVNEGGWRFRAAGVVNMFPHTSHVESIAVFDPPA